MTVSTAVPGLHSASTWRACPTTQPVVRSPHHQPTPQPGPAAPPGTVRLAVAVMEVVFGHRSVLTLSGHVAEPLLTDIALAQYSQRYRGGRVRKVRTQQPTPTAVEAVVSFVLGGRLLAAAIRLDLRRGSWRVSALSLA